MGPGGHRAECGGHCHGEHGVHHLDTGPRSRGQPTAAGDGAGRPVAQLPPVEHSLPFRRIKLNKDMID